MTTNPPDELDPDFNKPFVEHLDDLRKTLFSSAIFLLIGLLVAVPLTPYVLELAKVPVLRAGKDPDEFLRVIQIAGGFVLAMKIIFWTGLLFSAPLILISIAKFVFPGLKSKERIGVRIGLWATVLLFACGVMACYHITLPVAIKVMFKINAWLNIKAPWVEIGDYISFVLKLLIAFGAAFELPVIIMTLGHMGLISSAMLREYRKHAWVGIPIAAMILTPPDVFTQLLMALPMFFLYEFCVWAIYWREKKRDRGSDSSS